MLLKRFIIVRMIWMVTIALFGSHRFLFLRHIWSLSSYLHNYWKWVNDEEPDLFFICRNNHVDNISNKYCFISLIDLWNINTVVVHWINFRICMLRLCSSEQFLFPSVSLLCVRLFLLLLPVTVFGSISFWSHETQAFLAMNCVEQR